MPASSSRWSGLPKVRLAGDRTALQSGGLRDLQEMAAWIGSVRPESARESPFADADETAP